MKKKINVLGVDYEIYLLEEKDDYMASEDCDGYCDNYDKVIKVSNHPVKGYEDEVVLHELLHAFLYESGIEIGYGIHNEETVNWFALQFKKISKALEDYIEGELNYESEY